MGKNSNPQLIIGISVTVGICLIACVGIGIVAYNAPNLLDFSPNQSSLDVGTAAPDFELTALGGGTVRLSQFKGRPVLLSVGATWCPECRASTPVLQSLHESHPELVLLLLDLEEDANVVQGYVDEMGITYRVLLDLDGKVGKLYKVVYIPTELFIDADGIIRAKLVEAATQKSLADSLPLIGVHP